MGTRRTCTLMERYIRQIADGSKTVEARVATQMFAKWQAGDTVHFFSRRNPSVYVDVRLDDVREYDTFSEMLEGEVLDDLLPGIESKDAALREYLKIPGYREKEARFGVLAFAVSVLDSQL